jgi:hypothetical protein
MECTFRGTMTLTPDQFQQVVPENVSVSTAAILETDVLRIATRAVQLYAESHPRPAQVTIIQACSRVADVRQTLVKFAL